MEKDRHEQAEEYAMAWLANVYGKNPIDYFLAGQEWADDNPRQSLIEACEKMGDMVSKYRDDFLEANQKVGIAMEALEYISTRDWTIGIKKWDAEFVDVARKALEKIR